MENSIKIQQFFLTPEKVKENEKISRRHRRTVYRNFQHDR